MSESLRYRTYKLMAKGEWTSPKLAKALKIPEPQARKVLANMRYSRMIRRVSEIGYHGVYKRVEGIKLHPQGSGTAPRSLEALNLHRCVTGKRHKPTNGYGSEPCALEEAWPRR